MEPVPDRRRHPRTSCHIEAVVVLEEGLTRLPATILDTSPLGARLEVPEEAGLSEQFYMLFGHRIAPCRLVWRRDAEVGVAYRD